MDEKLSRFKIIYQQLCPLEQNHIVPLFLQIYLERALGTKIGAFII